MAMLTYNKLTRPKKALGHKTDSMWVRYWIFDEQEVEQAQLKTEQFLAQSDNLVTK
jgi:hypothetical protein